MAALGLVLHAGCLAWNVFGIYQNLLLTNTTAAFSGTHTYGGRWKFLTFLNQILQTGFFGFCLLCDLLHLCLSNKNKLCVFLTGLKDCLFAALAFPLGLFVVSSFWGLHAYDRELVYPKEFDSIIPQWLNHIMHTFIVLPLLIELFACSHQYPKKKNGLGFLMLFCLAYMLWVLWVHYAGGVWAYPILGKLNVVGLSLLFAASFLIMIPFYTLGEWLTKLRWGSQRPSKSKKKKKSK